MGMGSGGLLAALAAPLLWVLAAPAEAQARCGARATIVERLAEGFDETQVGSGLADGRILEVWVSADGGTWTILVTTAGGISCIVAAGEGWVTTPAPPAGEPM